MRGAGDDGGGIEEEEMNPIAKAIFSSRKRGLIVAWQMARASYLYSRMHDLGRIESAFWALQLFWEYL